MEVNCDYCGKLFDRRVDQILKYKNTFCSKECRRRGMLGVSHTGQFKVAYDHIDVNGNILCTECGKYLDESNFTNRSGMTHRKNKDYKCRSCSSHKKKVEYNVKRPAKIKYLKTLNGFLKNLLQASKNRKRSKILERNIDFEYLLDLYLLQNGKCAISGINMTTIAGEGNVPTNISVDRINSDIGYIKGNIQLVCRIVNTMKTDLSMDSFIDWCNLIVKNNKNE